MEKVNIVDVRDVPVGEISVHPANANRGNIAEIPEPSTVLLLGIAAIAIIGFDRRRRMVTRPGSH